LGAVHLFFRLKQGRDGKGSKMRSGLFSVGTVVLLVGTTLTLAQPLSAPLDNRPFAPEATPAELKSAADAQAIKTKYYEVLSWIQVALLILSILGSFLTILTFVIFSSIRSYPIKLICWLCSTIFIGQVLFLTVQFFAPNTFFCTYGGALVHYFFLANFFWCFCLAFNFYQLVRASYFQRPASQPTDLERKFVSFPPQKSHSFNPQ
jgi:hypothetical protein